MNTDNIDNTDNANNANNGDVASCCEVLKIRFGLLVLGASLGAGMGALNGWTGSLIMYGQDMLEATRMGAVGGAILGGIFLTREFFLCASEVNHQRGTREGEILFKAIILAELSGLLGFAILNAVGETSMNIGQASKSFVFGAAVSYTFLLVAACLGFCLCPVPAAAPSPLRGTLIGDDQRTVPLISDDQKVEDMEKGQATFTPLPGGPGR